MVSASSEELGEALPVLAWEVVAVAEPNRGGRRSGVHYKQSQALFGCFGALENSRIAGKLRDFLI